MSRVARYAVLGGVIDLSIYVVLSLAALLAERLGAGSLALAGLPVTWGVVYSASAAWGGRISDRVSRTSLMRLGMALLIGTSLLFTRADRVWHFYAGMPAVALGMALFWPALQAAIADESDPETLGRNLGWFNIAWSAGKGLGVLGGGILLDLWGPKGFYVAAGVTSLTFLLTPRVARGGGRGASLEPDGSEASRGARRAFRWAALLANFAAFGLGTTVISLYPEWNHELGRSGISYGVVVGGIFFGQTVAFAVLLRWPGWHYRILPLVLCQALTIVCAALLATGLPVILLVPLSLGVGAGFGIAYFSSIYYSLHSDVGRGGKAGLHETILGTGNFLVPLCAGTVARLADSSRVVYLFAAGVVAVSLLAQVAPFRSARRASRRG